MVLVEDGLVIEHGTGDGEQAVGDGAEGTGMTMAALAQGAILFSASGIVLYGDPGPVIDGVGEAPVGCQAADHDLALTGASGDRCDATQTA